MAIATNCIVLGAEGVGKSMFISKYLYNYLPSKYVPTKHPKAYSYTFSFPPPSVTLQISENIELPEASFSSAILLYDPLQPLTLDYVEKMLIEIQDKIPRKIGLVVASLVKGNSRQGNGRILANKFNAHFIVADLGNRNSIKKCFAICIQWGRKNLAWEAKKPFIYLREKVKLNLHA